MEDGLWTMRSALADALDQISSARSSLGARTKAFEAIEKQMAVAHSGRTDDQGNRVLEHFLALQYTFECNVALRLLPWIASATEKLEKLEESTEEKNHLEAFTLGAQLEQALTLLQGVAFSHEASKVYLGRLYPIQLLVDLLNISRYIPSSRKGDNTNSQALTASVLATLSSILISSSPAMRSFEEAGGPQAAVRIFKRSSTSKNVSEDFRLKILEFLYLYVMGEAPREGDKPTDSPLSDSPAPSPRKSTPPPTVPSTPVRPSKRYIGLGPAPRHRPSSTYGSSTYGSSEWQSPSPSLSAKKPLTPSSRSTSNGSTESGASTGSNVSNSTAATSVTSSPVAEKASAPKLAILTSNILTRDREKGRLSPKKRSSRTPSEFPSTPNGSAGSEGLIRTVPSTPTSSRPSSRHLLQTPVSSRASSRGDLAPEARRERSFRFPPPMQPRLVMTQDDVEPVTPLKTRTSLFSPAPQTPVKSPIGLGRPGIRHAKSKSMNNVLSETRISEEAAGDLKKAKRLGSAATVPSILESPKEFAIPVPQRSATYQTQAEKENVPTKDGVRKRSAEEKKKLLAKMLGSSSIDALIEGINKAGVQGFV